MNPHLEKYIRDWIRQGSRAQEALEWVSSKDNWLEKFPEHEAFINGLPSLIDRKFLRELCADERIDHLERFLGVMIWGYGILGYGSYRVSKMIHFSDTRKILRTATNFAQDGRPKDAYFHLMKNRIPILGPSYSSKYISFCTPRKYSAPILDSLILEWIQKYAPNDFTGFNLNKMNWNHNLYSHFCDWVEDHASEFSIFPDDVELVLFREAENEFASQSIWNDR
jgi:hypothetical protein